MIDFLTHPIGLSSTLAFVVVPLLLAVVSLRRAAAAGKEGR